MTLVLVLLIIVNLGTFCALIACVAALNDVVDGLRDVRDDVRVIQQLSGLSR